MRILVLNYEYPPVGGGGGFVTRDILEHITNMGHEVTVITSHYKGLQRQETVNGVDIARVPVLFRNKMEVASIPSMLSYFPSSFSKTVLSINGSMYDVINTHFAIPSGPTGYLLSKILRLPNVLSIHGGDIFDPSKSLSPHKVPVLSAVVRLMLKTSDRVVAQSNDTRTNAYTYYGISRQIDIIPLGIKKPVFEKKSRSDFDLDSDAIVFCTIGRLVKRKNIDDTLEVLSCFKNNYNFRFLIIGEGPERNHLEGLTKRLDLIGKVRFFGNVSDEVKFQLLDLSDCYVSTAIHEGFGLVFLEAMEIGLPVICYNRGGQNDFLEDGKTGFLVELGDRKKLAEKVLELMNDSDFCARVSAYNRELVQSYYISACAEKYLSLFDETISQYHNDRKS
ncbi:MAG: glycosyltransferase family 4 protein [Deltaproteobacteria bacterium]|nr:glycosyltransferase family 4 protein [Deltaproteobacteria bacterium]